ncbi:MAG: hypothetical protein ACFFHV_16440 [Promethearchaeota archaeon]
MNILEKNIAKIQISQSDMAIPKNAIGIDLGQTLTKIAYLENQNDLHLVILSTQADFDKINKFLESKQESFEKYKFTGGRAFNIHEKFVKRIDSTLLNEFQSNAKGIESLFMLTKKKVLPDSLIINIGTGTSVLLKKQSFKHIGGSAIGGGFFMGFIKLLYNLDDFQKAIKLAETGDRYNIDLKVSDIYESKDNRINLIFREFTAASFGKIENYTNLSDIKKKDVINSLICLIGENLGTMANLMAENYKINNLIFCGGFLRNNKILQRILSVICGINKKKAIFLKNSEFCGAIGALLS